MSLLEISVNFDILDQLLIRCSLFFRYWRENGSRVGHFICCL